MQSTFPAAISWVAPPTSPAGPCSGVVDGSGNVYETTLDESSDLVDETSVGSLTGLPAEEEYQDEEGQRIRIVKDKSGTTIVKLHLGSDSNVLDLEIACNTE